MKNIFEDGLVLLIDEALISENKKDSFEKSYNVEDFSVQDFSVQEFELDSIFGNMCVIKPNASLCFYKRVPTPPPVDGAYSILKGQWERMDKFKEVNVTTVLLQDKFKFVLENIVFSYPFLSKERQNDIGDKVFSLLIKNAEVNEIQAIFQSAIDQYYVKGKKDFSCELRKLLDVPSVEDMHYSQRNWSQIL